MRAIGYARSEKLEPHWMADIPINTRVMAPLGDILHPGVVVEPDGEAQPGMVRVKLTPPVMAASPFRSFDFVTCPADRVTLGWF
jgi:hypothetical protein